MEYVLVRRQLDLCPSVLQREIASREWLWVSVRLDVPKPCRAVLESRNTAFGRR